MGRRLGLIRGDGEAAPEQIPPWKACLATARMHRGDTRLPKVSFVWALVASLETLASRTFPADHWACSRPAKTAEPAGFDDLQGRSDKVRHAVDEPRQSLGPVNWHSDAARSLATSAT